VTEPQSASNCLCLPSDIQSSVTSAINRISFGTFSVVGRKPLDEPGQYRYFAKIKIGEPGISLAGMFHIAFNAIVLNGAELFFETVATSLNLETESPHNLEYKLAH
jgi:hypothetical protein